MLTEDDTNNGVWFVTSTVAKGNELYFVKDFGASYMTFLFDISPGAASTQIDDILPINGKVLVAATSAGGQKGLWVSENLGPFAFIKSFTSMGPMVKRGSTAFFAGDDGGAAGLELWLSQGTALMTEVRDINRGAMGSNPTNLVVSPADNRLYYVADIGEMEPGQTNGRKLYEDLVGGPVTAVASLADIVLQNHDVSFYRTFVGNDYFFAAEPNDGGENDYLYVFDGVTGELTRLATFATDSLRYFASFNNRAYFAATEIGADNRLWSSNGTVAGTSMHVDAVNPQGVLAPMHLAAGTLALYFSAHDAAAGRELHSLSADSVSLVGDLEPGIAGSHPRSLVTIQNTVYFIADTTAHGTEVWSSAGFGPFVAISEPLRAGPTSSTPDYLTRRGNKLYFSVSTPAPTFDPCNIWVYS